MSHKVKDIDTKNRIYYFFNNIINIKNFDPSNIKIENHTKSHTKIFLFTTLNM